MMIVSTFPSATPTAMLATRFTSHFPSDSPTPPSLQTGSPERVREGAFPTPSLCRLPSQALVLVHCSHPWGHHHRTSWS